MQGSHINLMTREITAAMQRRTEWHLCTWNVAALYRDEPPAHMGATGCWDAVSPYMLFNKYWLKERRNKEASQVSEDPSQALHPLKLPKETC